jgi:hypothetical protein
MTSAPPLAIDYDSSERVVGGHKRSWLKRPTCTSPMCRKLNGDHEIPA